MGFGFVYCCKLPRSYEEKAPIMLYDWKIPLFLSNILFLVCLFVEQSMRSALIKKKKNGS